MSITVKQDREELQIEHQRILKFVMHFVLVIVQDVLSNCSENIYVWVHVVIVTGLSFTFRQTLGGYLALNYGIPIVQ